MSPLDRLERVFGRFAVPNLTLYFIIGQVFVLLARMLNLFSAEALLYAPILVMQGDWWRPVTFLFLTPVPTSAFGYIFAVFGWYILYLMGSALEAYWGVFRYNVFLFTSILLTLALSFLTPYHAVTNLYIFATVFLAFAFINPDFELLLFFVLPLKIKWLAAITWVLYAVSFVRGDWALRLQILAPAVTWFLFFGGQVVRGVRQGRRSAGIRAERVREQAQPRHICHVCGKTDLSHPELDFRYCSKCAGDQCYCPEHIHNHAHVVAPEAEPQR